MFVDLLIEGAARQGYGALAVDGTDERIAGTLISPVVDELLASSPCQG